MTDKPDLPVVGGAAGALMTHMPGKAVNRAIMGVFNSLGGEQFLEDWVRSSPERTDTFVEKLLPKLIVKEVDMVVTKGVEDLLDELDREVIEGEFKEVDDSGPPEGDHFYD